jgi:hypothetical protein
MRKREKHFEQVPLDKLHFHINWSSSGFNSERFDHYQDAIETAHEFLENGQRALPCPPAPLAVISNKTFAVEMFDEPCPVCLRTNRPRLSC